MKKILYILSEKFADWEMAYISSAINMLGNGQFENITVGLTAEPVRSIGGLVCIPDFDILSYPKDYSALILIGGMSWRSESAKKIKAPVEDCIKNGKILGAICDASSFLGSIGALNNVYHTSNDLNDLKHYNDYCGEKYFIAKQCVRDKNIITANGTAALEFAKELMSALDIADKNTINGFYNFHKLGFYTASMSEI